MLRDKEQFIIDKTGKKKFVILSLKEYKRLLEDLHDLILIVGRKDEKVISHKEMMSRLRHI